MSSGSVLDTNSGGGKYVSTTFGSFARNLVVADRVDE
jgi:hypothetical protein